MHTLMMVSQVTEHVGSYLELFATLYGLRAGEQFFSLFWSLGLFKLIFAVIAWATVIEGWRMGGADGGWFIIRMLGWRFLGMFVVLMIFVWPSGTLDIGQMRYQPPPTFANADQPPTAPMTVLSAMARQTHGVRGFELTGAYGGYDIKVPPALRLMMMVGHGLNNATTKVLPSRLSMRLLDQGLANMRIADPQLKADLGAFNQQCYVPAVNKWQSFWRDKSKPAALVARETGWGIEDVGWMGSRILLETPGLYAPCGDVAVCGSSLQSSEPIRGVAWDPSRDGTRMDWMPATSAGRPYCSDWWTSLRTRVYSANSGLLPKFNAIMNGNLLRQLVPGGGGLGSWIYSAEDVVVRIVLSRANTEEMFSDDLSYYTGKVKSDTTLMSGVQKQLSKGLTEFAAWTGNLVSQPFASIETLTQNNLQQITQAIVLLCLYLAFPFVAVFSGLKADVLFTYCILVMSVVNWQMWWSITMWVDSNLLMSMYPDDGSFVGYMEEIGSKRMLLDRVTNAMSVLAPSVWTFILTIAGWKGASALTGLTGQMAKKNQQIAEQVARNGLAAVQQLANFAVSMLPAGGLASAGGALTRGMSAFTGRSGKPPSSGRAT